MLSSLLIILVVVVVILIAIIVIDMMQTKNTSESFLDLLPAQTNEVESDPMYSENAKDSALAASPTYMDSFKHVYKVDNNLLKNPLFADYYKNWWIPKTNGRYGDWKYRNPYWFPAKFEARPIRDSLSVQSNLDKVCKMSESEYKASREKDLKRLGYVSN